MSSGETIKTSKIELANPEGLSVTINPEGAYVESLIAPNGADLLFPRQTVNGKDRGGVFACAPIFGPGEAVGLKQHGYARNLNWEVSQQDDESAVFKLDNPQLQDGSLGHYEGCKMTMTVKLDELSLVTRLKILNDGKMPFVISPGFHPYFPAKGSVEDVEIGLSDKDTVQYTAEELAVTQTLDSDMTDPLVVSNGDQEAIIESNGLKVPVAWSDNPQYFCVEPTAVGAVTNGDQENLVPYTLAPGGEAEFDMKITWKGSE